jgi:predicted DNA-binding protein
MTKLTKIQRFRFSEETIEKLHSLNKFGKSKSRFVRDAINEKLLREYPLLLKEKNKIQLPF